MFEWVQKWQDIAKTKNKWCIHCRRLQFYWYTFYFDGFLVDVIEIHSICHCRISLRICLQKLNCNVIRQSGNVSVNVVYCLFFFPVSFSIRFSFSHLIKWTPFFCPYVVSNCFLFLWILFTVQWIRLTFLSSIRNGAHTHTPHPKPSRDEMPIQKARKRTNLVMFYLWRKCDVGWRPSIINGSWP